MHDERDKSAAFLNEHPHFVHGLELIGPTLRLREATPSDAEFVLFLRLDEDKSRHISPTLPDVERQRQWIANSSIDPGQLYYIAEHEGRPVGTIRLYEPHGTACTVGSWILANDRPRGAPKESVLLIFALSDHLGFTATLFDVRRENKRSWLFLSNALGAERYGETDADYLYRMTRRATRQALRKFGRVQIVDSAGQRRADFLPVAGMGHMV